MVSYCQNAILISMTTLIGHKRAKFDYEILETFEAGIVLHGYEVKSVRNGRGKIEGAYVIVRGGEAFLVGASISPYQTANMPKNYNPERPRKLLLSKKQLTELSQQGEKKGLTLVPISVYNKGRYIKVQVCVVKGKKNYDKREKIKERETDRSILRTLKNQK